MDVKVTSPALGGTIVGILQAVLGHGGEGRAGEHFVDRPSVGVGRLEGEAATEATLNLKLQAVVARTRPAVQLADAAIALVDPSRVGVAGGRALAENRHVLFAVIREVPPHVSHVRDFDHQIVRYLLLQRQVVGLHVRIAEPDCEAFRNGHRKHEIRIARVENERERVQPPAERSRKRERVVEVDRRPERLQGLDAACHLRSQRIVRDSVARAHRCAAVTENVPGDPESGSDVDQIVLVGKLRIGEPDQSVGSIGYERGSRARDQRGLLILLLFPARVEFVAHPHGHRHVALDLEAVLKEDSRLNVAVVEFDRRGLADSTRPARNEVRHGQSGPVARELPLASGGAVVSVEELISLRVQAPLEVVVALDPAHVPRQGVVLRQALAVPSRAQSKPVRDLDQRTALDHAAGMIEVRRAEVGQVILERNALLVVEPGVGQADRVHEGRRDQVVVLQRVCLHPIEPRVRTVVDEVRIAQRVRPLVVVVEEPEVDLVPIGQVVVDPREVLVIVARLADLRHEAAIRTIR